MNGPDPLRAIREASAIWIMNWLNWVNRCLVWLLCCLTVILGPPATFALFYAAHYSIHGAELTVGELAASVRAYFWQSWLWMLANLAVGAGLWGLAAAGSALGAGRAVGWAVALIGLFWLGIQYYALPIFMLQERKRIWRAWGSAARVAFSAPLFTLITFGLALVLGLVSLILVAPLAMGGAGLIVVLAAQATFERLQTFHLPEEE
ncbi:MAG TPA: hypothetical protein VGJ97_12565 [Anaerolineaceae bacterium]